MGRSQESFNKKEIRKKNEKKRLEKEKRKLKKKESGKQSLDDMIAYVDENGVITDTPPDPTKKKEVDVESIEIQTPKKEEVEEQTTNLKGKVTKYDHSKRYGFIALQDSNDSVFFHYNDCIDEVDYGDKVIFDIEQGHNGLKAKDVKLSK